MDQAHDLQTRHRGIRLQRLNLAIYGWAVALGLVFFATTLGQTQLGLLQLGVISTAVLAMLLAIHVGLRLGWTARFSDPSLTLPHMLVAALVALYILGQAGDARTILLLPFIIVVLFGVLQLRKEEYALVAAVCVVGYGLILVRNVVNHVSVANTLLALEFATFAITIFWVAFFGTYVANLRRRLSERNRQLDEASEHLRHLSEHDELTGLSNRRRILVQLEQARRMAEHNQRPFCVALLDLDHFKRVNDQHGHQVGDEVLAEFAERVERVLRDSDRLMRMDAAASEIGRFGGEEFLTMLGGTDLHGALIAAERLRRAIGEKPFSTDAGEIPCTVSIGVAEYRPGEEVHQTIGRADDALYQGKNQGRNRVVNGESG